jgi:transposase
VPMLADAIDAVLGVDVHRDVHHAEIAAPSGAVIAACAVPNTSGGYALLDWAHKHASGPRLAVSIEGTRSYGAGLARAAAAAGLVVIECEQPTRRTRRGKGKPDPIDAHLAALTALRLDTTKLPVPRADGDREALRILLCARQELTTLAAARANRLRALLRDGDDTDRDLARACRLSGTALAGRAQPSGASRAQAVRHAEIRRLALALLDRAQQVKANHRELNAIISDLAPGLTSRPGIGPRQRRPGHRVVLPPGRCRHDAAFAALAGTSPIEASSGQTTRHRLNRGGDRALNQAIHMIAVTRMRVCARTRDYVQRRTAQDKSTREIRRCLSDTSPGSSIARSRPPRLDNT